jgi:hypothetical protein
MKMQSNNYMLRRKETESRVDIEKRMKLLTAKLLMGPFRGDFA